jgi:hypothetical protein
VSAKSKDFSSNKISLIGAKESLEENEIRMASNDIA